MTEGISQTQSNPEAHGISGGHRIYHWIDGRRTPGSSGRTAPVYNPATGQRSADVDLASGDEINDPVAKAVAA